MAHGELTASDGTGFTSESRLGQAHIFRIVLELAQTTPLLAVLQECHFRIGGHTLDMVQWSEADGGGA